MKVALPQIVAEIAAVAGTDAAWRLVAARGGTRIFLPRRVSKTHWLAGIVGQDAANKICAHFRGNHTDNILVPMASATRKARVWAEVLAQGLSVDEAALTMAVHRRTVFRRKRMQDASPDDQETLF